MLRAYALFVSRVSVRRETNEVQQRKKGNVMVILRSSRGQDGMERSNDLMGDARGTRGIGVEAGTTAVCVCADLVCVIRRGVVGQDERERERERERE